MRLLFFFIPTALAGYDTLLEKKCTALRGRYRATYFDSSCYVATAEEKSIKLEQWADLHKDCIMLNGYKGHMAYINTEGKIDKLSKGKGIFPGERYFIGARQDPISDCGGKLCKRDVHIKNWYFLDNNMKKVMDLNASLWLKDEPNNMGEFPPEHVVALERFDTYQVGFNDMNPELNKFKTLCEFEDFVACSENYTLVRDKCYRFFKEPKSASEAKSACANDDGVLASIHDDAMNNNLIQVALDTAKSKEIEGAVRFGLRYENSWQNLDGTDADYFRWFENAGCGDFSSGGGAALGVSSASSNPVPSYWIVVQDNDKLPFFCQKDASSAYDI